MKTQPPMVSAILLDEARRKIDQLKSVLREVKKINNHIIKAWLQDEWNDTEFAHAITDDMEELQALLPQIQLLTEPGEEG